MDLLEELAQLCGMLKAEGVDYALCGGLAMAVYAFPRATLDIDIMIEPESLERAKEVGRALGFRVDAGLMEFQKGAIRIYRLTKIPPESADALVLDMLLVTPRLRGVWNSRRRVRWEMGELPVVSPQGLIELKSLRGSGQDMDDIKHLRSIADEDGHEPEGRDDASAADE
jgi:hypothetical protein